MKCRFVKTLINWLVVNVFVILPLWWVATNELPDRLEIKVKTDAPLTVNVLSFGDADDRAENPVTIRSAYQYGNDRSQVLGLYLPVPTDLGRIGFGFECGTGIVEVASIEAVQRSLFRRVLSPEALKREFVPSGNLDVVSAEDVSLRLSVTGGGGCLVPRQVGSVGWRWQLANGGKTLILLLVMETGLLLFSLLFACVRTDGCSARKLLVQVMAIALFTALFYAFVLPIQSYRVNQSSFGFALSDLLCASSLSGLAIFVGVTVALFFASRCFGRVVCVAMTFFLVYEYLETGVLAFDHPPLNGEAGFFQDAFRRLWDTVFFLAFIGLGTLFTCWLKGCIHWIALAFLTLSLLSLFDVRREVVGSQEGFVVTDFSTKTALLKSAFYSAKRNIMVFVLDMATSEVAEDVIGRDSEIRAKYEGFVCYQNNVGMHMCTILGTAGLLTGRYLEDPADFAEYGNSLFTDKSLVADYQKADVPQFISPGSKECGYTNRRSVSPETRQSATSMNKSGSPFKKRISGQQEWNLYEIIRFRAAPFIAKDFLMRMSNNGWLNAAGELDECRYYAYLKNAPTSSDSDLTLHWHHTNGCHPPLSNDRFGHRLAEMAYDYNGHLEKLWYVMRLLGDLFDEYRRRGLYDGATIIICADHGGTYEAGNAFIRDGMTPKGLPMLWVKPAYAKGPIVKSRMPTSHSKVADVVRRSITANLSRTEIEAILKTSDRVFRESSGSDFLDWHVDASGRVEKRIVSVSPDISKVGPVELGCTYFKRVEETAGRKLFLFKDVDVLSDRIWGTTQSASFEFRVPDALKTYTVEVKLHLQLEQMGGKQPVTSDDPYVWFSATGAIPQRAYFKNDKNDVIVLRGAKPDGRGVVRVDINRHGFNDAVFFSHIRVSK